VTDQEWKRLKYFRKDEKPFGFGDPSKINFQLLYFLDCFREYINCPIIVRCGTQGVHVARWHSLGLAVDVLVDTKYIHPLDLLLAAERFPFTGVGINLVPKYDDMMKPVALHLDLRTIDNMPKGCIARRWIWFNTSQGFESVPLTHEFLEQFGVFSWYEEDIVS
jgi:hypothetical protein